MHLIELILAYIVVIIIKKTNKKKKTKKKYPTKINTKRRELNKLYKICTHFECVSL